MLKHCHSPVPLIDFSIVLGYSDICRNFGYQHAEQGFNEMKKQIFVPGRTELAGNHTDHQNGRMLASAVHFGHYATCEENGSNIIRVQSEGFQPFEVNINHLTLRTTEFGTSKSLVRGVVAGFKELGLNIGGFDARVRSTLSSGSGLSSSAAFSVLAGRMLSELFNNGEVQPVVLARIGQQAENKFFGKPCGIMSQLASAMGHTVYCDPKTGEIEPIRANFTSMGLTMCLTNTGGSHSGLDTSYARIPADMVYIANFFDKGVLGDVDPKEFYRMGWDPANRPVRRAMHFFEENDRVPKMRDALKRGDGALYMRHMNASGRSSEQLLNNIITSATGDTKLAQGLELSRRLLDGKGAWRVHGGGFAGCVQALMPIEFFPEYKRSMEEEFGIGSCIEINLI